MGRVTGRNPKILVLGLGNSLLSDDGVGVHVIGKLAQRGPDDLRLLLRDGGTVGLNLLPEIQDTDHLIVVDASEMKAPPGTVRTFTGADMDRQVGGTKKTAHEVALSDLLDTASLTGGRPANRALVGVQPATTGWGLEPTGEVMAAVDVACGAVISLARSWTMEASDAPVTTEAALA